ncbi:MAG: DinB family protein [Deltaproteobacteria bacterium]|nr:DinB family protein [Deltaproteobacteria bacterium]
MATIEYFRSAAKSLHGHLLDALQGLPDEHLHFRPLGKGNHIAFTIWHCVRTEDLAMNSFLQKRPPLWKEEGWDKKFGLEPEAQGTGMTAEQAAAVRIVSLDEFIVYMRNVFRATEAYLEGLREEDLERVSEYPYFGKRSLAQMIGGVLLFHGSGHLGEIWYVKGLLGLKGGPG